MLSSFILNMLNELHTIVRIYQAISNQEFGMFTVLYSFCLRLNTVKRQKVVFFILFLVLNSPVFREGRDHQNDVA